MPLVLDTSVLLAYADRSDRDNSRCAELIDGYDGDLVIPEPVIIELDYLLATRIDPSASVALVEDINAYTFKVERLTARDYSRIEALMSTYLDMALGFVDIAVLVIVERLGEKRLATLDQRHFSVVRPIHTEALELLPV